MTETDPGAAGAKADRSGDHVLGDAPAGDVPEADRQQSGDAAGDDEARGDAGANRADDRQTSGDETGEGVGELGDDAGDTSAEADETQPGDEPGPGEPDAKPAEPEHGGAQPGDEPDDQPRSVGSGLSWARAAVLAVALAFLGFALGTYVTRDTSPGPDSVDVGFYRDMVAHHDQALQLASLGLANAQDLTVRGFAQEVIGFQNYERGVMESTLHDWGYSPEHQSDEAMAWMGMPVPVGEMPGMLTDEQLDQMRNAEGTEADALFLELMAQHHLGGLHMAQEAVQRADDHDVRNLATRMARNQAIEVNEYRQTAERLGLPVDIPRVAVPDE